MQGERHGHSGPPPVPAAVLRMQRRRYFRYPATPRLRRPDAPLRPRTDTAS